METAHERFGKYHVLERLAQGGMAEVYKVKTVGIAGFEKIQALKRILPDSAQENRFIRSFIDEARIAVELNHRNIVSVFDFGKADGELYLAMELIEGKDLRAACADGGRRGYPIPAEVAAYVISEVAAGLDYAHRKTDGIGGAMGIVHCDISPSNIMLSIDGGVKILDFGIARASFASALERRRLRGKPRYMAPEQTRGENPTYATDVFALGIIAWELFTGRALFRGSDLKAILWAVRNEVPPTLASLDAAVSSEISQAVATALSQDPGARGTVNDLGIACARLGMLAGARGVANWLAQTSEGGDDGWLQHPSSNASISVNSQPPTPAIDTDSAPRLPPVRLPTEPLGQTESVVISNLAHAGGIAKKLAIANRIDPFVVTPPPVDFDGNATHTAVLADADIVPDVRSATRGTTNVSARYTSQSLRGQSLDAIDDGNALASDGGFVERRRAVVLFALLDGGTDGALGQLAKSVGDLAYQRGGVVISQEVRGLLVAFGLEIVGEDDVSMAMAWALDASALVRDSQDRTMVTLRVGARTGVTISRSDASKIPDEVIEETHALARDAAPERPLFAGGAGRVSSAHYALREVPARRGSPRRGKVLELVGLRSFDERDRALFERRGKFVGRSKELGELTALFDQALARAERMTALIRGGVGVGKSRLLAEFVATLGSTHAPRVISANASSANGLAPFALITELCQILVGTPPARGRAARSKVAQLIAAHLRASGVSDELAKAAASDIDLAMELRDGVSVADSEPSDLRSRVAVAFHALRYARRQIGRGAVILIEDLHSADAASIEVLRHCLVSREPGAELLIVTSRDAADLGFDVSLELPDLVGGELRTLIIDRLAAAATPLNVAAVLARSGGNPLFVEELASAVSQDADEIPATAREVIAARVDKLSASTKATLRYAAVMSGAVRARLLEELMGSDIAIELSELAQERFLLRSDANASDAGDGDLHFPRGLVREVVYESLSQRAQRETHARIGRLLSARFFAGREEPPSLIADHLEQGGDLSGAAAFWVRSGRLALAAFDADGAVAHFTRVLDLERELAATSSDRHAPASPASVARRREALLGREEAHRMQGDLASHESDLQILQELCASDTERLADLACRSAERARRRGDFAAAYEATIEAERLAKAAGNVRWLGMAHKLRGEVLERQGRFDEALKLLGDATALFADCGDVVEELATSISIGRIHLSRSRFELAQNAFRPVVSRIRHGGDPWLERSAKVHMAAIQRGLGNFTEAIESAERSLELSRRYGDRAGEGESQMTMGAILVQAGQLHQASSRFTLGLDLLERTQSRFAHAQCLMLAGECDALQNNPNGVRRIDEAIAQARELGARHLEAVGLVARAGALLAFSTYEQAVRDAAAGAALAGTTNATAAMIIGGARQAFGFAQLGRKAEALVAMRRAVSLLEDYRYVDGSEEEVWWRAGEVALLCQEHAVAARYFDNAWAGLGRKLSWLDDDDAKAAFASMPLYSAVASRVKP